MYRPKEAGFLLQWQYVRFWLKYCGTMEVAVIWLGSNFTPLQYSTNNIRSWVSIHIEELTVSQLVKIFPTVYEAQRFMTKCSTACQFSFCWVRLIKTTPSHPVCLRSIVILPSISYSTDGTVQITRSLHCNLLSRVTCCRQAVGYDCDRDFVDRICCSSNTVCISRLHHFTSQKTVMYL